MSDKSLSQAQLIEKLSNENKTLLAELELYKKQEKFIKMNVEKSRQAFEVASHNAGRIIMKAVDFAYELKKEITKLLVEIEQNRYNLQDVLKSIDDFIDRNKKIYAFSLNDGERITEMIKKEIISKIK